MEKCRKLRGFHKYTTQTKAMQVHTGMRMPPQVFLRRHGKSESELGAPVVVSILLALAAKLGLLMEIAGIGLAI